MNEILNDVRSCWVNDLNGTIGLTCKNYFIRVLLSHKDAVIVAAHENGHTLGGTEIFKSDIKASCPKRIGKIWQMYSS